MSVYDNLASSMVANYLGSATIKAMLMTSSYVQNTATEKFLSDITALGQEVTDSGYSRQTLTNVVVSTANDVVVLTCDQINFGTPTASLSAGAVIFYVDTGTESTSTLISADMSGFDVPIGVSAIYEVSSVISLTIPTDGS